MDVERLNPWFEEWARAWRVPALPDRLHVRPGPRLRRSLGRCHPASGTIRLHPELFEAPENLLKEVLCHEAAHVAAHLRHGPTVRPHGPEWAGLMREAGYEPRVRMDPANLPALLQRSIRPRVLFRHLCRTCGANRMARRAVHRWRCRACTEAGLAGRLEIRSVRATDAGAT